MRILVYGLNYTPELTGIGKFSGEMCSWLAAKGHEIRVITAPPYYPAWKIKEGYSGKRYRKELFQGVRITRCPLWVPSKPSGLKRMAHLLSFAISSFPAALAESVRWKPDVVFTVEPALFSAPGAWVAALAGGARTWLHIQDFEIDAAFDLGIVKGAAMRAFVADLEKFLMNRFDAVSTISPRMIEKLATKMDGPRGLYFPNWVDTSSIFPQPHRNILREELGIPDSKTVLLYSGNMGEKQGLEIIIESARSLSGSPELLFVLCGDGAVKNKLVEMAKGLENVLFMELQPIERLNDLLNMADIHLLPQRADVEDLVMPSKLLGIFASGKPVIATAHKGTQVAKAVTDRGLVVEPGDARLFTGAILTLSKSPDLSRRYGEAARKYCMENWGKDEVLSRFEQELRSMKK